MGLLSNRRARAVLLVLSLVGLGRESVLPHDCATMGASAAAVSVDERGAPASATAAPAGHEHAAAAGHDHAAHATAPADHEPSSAPSGHECDCIGDCCCVPVVSLALSRAEPLAPMLTATGSASVASSDARLPVAPRYLRPFAIGPPAVIAA